MLKRRGNGWQIDITYTDPVTGVTKRVRESAKTTSRDVALERELEVELALRRGQHVAPVRGGIGAETTIARCFDRALAGDWLSDASSGASLRSAMIAFRALTNGDHFRASDAVAALNDPHKIALMVRDMAAKGLKASSQNHRLWVVRNILKQAAQDKVIAAACKVPSNRSLADSHRVEILSFEDEPRVLQYMKLNAEQYGDLHDLIVILLGTGVRISEGLLIKRKDIVKGLGRKMVVVGKGNKRRTVVHSAESLRVTLARLERNDGVAFPEAHGGEALLHKARTAYEKAWKKVREACELDDELVCHSMRHTYATRLLDSGVNVRLVQELLGHEKIETTMRYLKVMATSLDNVASQMDRYATLKSVTTLVTLAVEPQQD